jgi:hypothetical protein
MNRLMNILTFAFLSLVALVATVILWPFALAGFLALALSGLKFNRWISSGLALVLVVKHNKPRRDNHYQPFSFDDFPDHNPNPVIDARPRW